MSGWEGLSLWRSGTTLHLQGGRAAAGSQEMWVNLPWGRHRTVCYLFSVQAALWMTSETSEEITEPRELQFSKKKLVINYFKTQVTEWHLKNLTRTKVHKQFVAWCKIWIILKVSKEWSNHSSQTLGVKPPQACYDFLMWLHHIVLRIFFTWNKSLLWSYLKKIVFFLHKTVTVGEKYNFIKHICWLDLIVNHFMSISLT